MGVHSLEADTEPWVDENLAGTREELVHPAGPASGGHATHDAFLQAGDEAHAPALGGAKIRAGWTLGYKNEIHFL